MTKISLFSLIFISYLFFYLNNPLLLSLILILFILFLVINIALIFSSWVAISIMLVFLGGMMVLYLYIVTLTKAEKLIVPLLFSLMGSISGVFLLSTFFYCFEINSNIFSASFTLNFLYSQINLGILLFLTLYLLITLFTVMKLSECFKGALTKFK